MPLDTEKREGATAATTTLSRWLCWMLQTYYSVPNANNVCLPASTNYCHDDVAAVVLNAPYLD